MSETIKLGNSYLLMINRVKERNMIMKYNDGPMEFYILTVHAHETDHVCEGQGLLFWFLILMGLIYCGYCFDGFSLVIILPL